MSETILRQTICGEALVLRTAPELFSPRRVDRGTLAMLSVAEFAPGMKVLDLGCGCGVVGLVAAKKCGDENVWMTDVDPEAVEIARQNAMDNGLPGVHLLVSDGFSQLDEAGFDLICSNPPYQSDFKIAKHFIEKGFNRLKPGGMMLMVVKRREWYKNKLTAIFGGVKIHEIDGYFVFSARRRTEQYANARKNPGRERPPGKGRKGSL